MDKANTDTVANVLQQRGDRYGKYELHSETKEKIINLLSCLPSWKSRSQAIHRQAACMIVDKLVRAFNGDPHYDDNWVDIQGYAKLVERWIDDHKELKHIDKVVDGKESRQPITLDEKGDLKLKDDPYMLYNKCNYCEFKIEEGCCAPHESAPEIKCEHFRAACVLCKHFNSMRSTAGECYKKESGKREVVNGSDRVCDKFEMCHHLIPLRNKCVLCKNRDDSSVTGEKCTHKTEDVKEYYNLKHYL